MSATLANLTQPRRLLLFSAIIQESYLEVAVGMPGWSHKATADHRLYGTGAVKVFFFVPNRRQATKQIDRCASVRSLDDGRRCDGLIAACHRKAFNLR
jgi:hypothetical protein